MKRRRSVFVTFVVLALLCLGFGYAALTDQLQIGGSADGAGINEENEAIFDIEFDTTVDTTCAATSKNTSGSNKLTATATYGATGEDNGTITITNMRFAGDKVVATFEVKNTSPDATYDARLSATPTLTDAGTNTAEIGTDIKIDAAFDTPVIAQGETSTLTVTITLVNDLLLPTDIVDLTISVAISATAE